MKWCTLRKLVNNEAVEFIKVWQTSHSLNEVVDRLSQSSIWQEREQRLGSQLIERWDEKRENVIYSKRVQDDNFTTRNLVKTFERYLRRQKFVNLKTLSWKCVEDSSLIDLKRLADSYH